MGFYVDYREPNAYLRDRKHFDSFKEAKTFVLNTIKQHEDFYKTCKSIDSGCFDIHPDFEYGKSSKIYRIIATEDHYKDPECFDMEEELEDSFIYRGVAVNVYEDDYGQCYYFKCMINGELHESSCGGWNPDYKTVITNEIDYMLDRGV